MFSFDGRSSSKKPQIAATIPQPKIAVVSRLSTSGMHVGPGNDGPLGCYVNNFAGASIMKLLASFFFDSFGIGF